MNWEVGRVYRTRSNGLARISSVDPVLMATNIGMNFDYPLSIEGNAQIRGGDLIELVREQHEADALASPGSIPSKEAVNVRHAAFVNRPTCG
jgi:hypothetical protein